MAEGKRSKRADGDGLIRQRQNGLWEIQFTLPDGGRKSVYGKTLTEAKNKRKSALKLVDEGVDLDKAKMTLAAYLDLWLETQVKPTRAPRTHASYAELARIHIVPKLGHVKLIELTPAHIADLMRAKEREGKSPRTVEMIRSVLVTSLGRAEKWGMIPRNVARLTDAPKARSAEVQPMTPEQARAFLASIQGDRLEALYRVALSLGLRQGEALGLSWEDIDLEAETLRVRHTLQRLHGQLSLKEPKTEKSRRTLPLPAFTVHALRAHRIRQLEERLVAGGRWEDTGLVFTTPVGGPLDGGNLLKLYRTHLAAAGLPAFRFHDLRHSAASLLLAQGISPHEVQATLGHAHFATTMDIYAHLYPETRQRVAAAMDAILSEGVAV